MPVNAKLVGIIWLLLLTPVTGWAAVYKWTDSDGNVHFTDKPPPKDQADDVEQPDVQLRNVDQGYPSVDAGVTINLSGQQRSRQQTQQQQVERRAAECDDAAQRLRLISGRVEYFDDDGNRVVRSEAYRRKEETEIRDFLAKNCS